MPRVRRKVKQRTGWTADDRQVLRTGGRWNASRLHGGRRGYDHDACRAAWEELRSELMAEHLATVWDGGYTHSTLTGLGSRPWAWWKFDSPEPRLVIDPHAAFCVSSPECRFSETVEALHCGAPYGYGRHARDYHPSVESQTCFLARHSLLTASELEQLDDTQELLDPDCTGDGDDGDGLVWFFSLAKASPGSLLALLNEIGPPTKAYGTTAAA